MGKNERYVVNLYIKEKDFYMFNLFKRLFGQNHTILSLKEEVRTQKNIIGTYKRMCDDTLLYIDKNDFQEKDQIQEIKANCSYAKWYYDLTKGQLLIENRL